MSSEPISSQLEAIERYSELFSAVRIEEDGVVVGGSEDDLVELNRLHAEILLRARDLQDRLSGDLAGLKSKGKLVMRYLDHLPRRISSRRPKKG
ncbi:MAG: hypothetical protein KDD60_03030 [Bdellovibrionales bacterium]|nr:hypothetical protein [Bdellovibrionales bacterium]